MRILCVHAHCDDYEFVASGLFELWRQKPGDNVRRRVLVCTDGRAGHHFRTRAETEAIRALEQEQSAALGKYELEFLKLPDGERPREACLRVTTDLLAALWKSIRDFEPDYLFCPPVAADPWAGIHVDHVAVAEAVRQVAYMINVPHAFTPEYPAEETRSELCKVPVILNVHDSYMSGANAYDLAVDIEPVFGLMAEMSWCHQSQIMEWLPWVGRHDLRTPESLNDWKNLLHRRFQKRNQELGLPPHPLVEVFTVTAWGAIPTLEQLTRDFPALAIGESRLEALHARLQKWS